MSEKHIDCPTVSAHDPQNKNPIFSNFTLPQEAFVPIPGKEIIVTDKLGLLTFKIFENIFDNWLVSSQSPQEMTLVGLCRQVILKLFRERLSRLLTHWNEADEIERIFGIQGQNPLETKVFFDLNQIKFSGPHITKDAYTEEVLAKKQGEYYFSYHNQTCFLQESQTLFEKMERKLYFPHRVCHQVSRAGSTKQKNSIEKTVKIRMIKGDIPILIHIRQNF